MESKALYLLAQFDEETNHALAGYYDSLVRAGFVGTQTKCIPYHFTLGSRETDMEEELAERLESVCAETTRIEICLAHVGLFGLNVMFVAPNMNLELLSLQRRFFPHCGSGNHPWAAHATLLIDESERILKAIPIVAEQFSPRKATIESVSLYEFFPTRCIRECRLAGT